MTTAADRRVLKLETALTPTEAVLAWLVEAQQFPTIEDQARAIAQLPTEVAPLSVIAQRVETAVRGTMKGRPHEDVREAVRRNLGDAAFLFTFVMEVEGQTVEMAKVEGLRAAAAFFWMGTLLGGPRALDLPTAEKAVYVRELADAWASWRSVLGRLRLDVKVENDARSVSRSATLPAGTFYLRIRLRRGPSMSISSSGWSVCRTSWRRRPRPRLVDRPPSRRMPWG